MILFVCALNQEMTTVRRYLSSSTAIDEGRERSWRLWKAEIHGAPVLLLKTGMGVENASIGLGNVIKSYPVSRILNIGFGAAAIPGLGCGDLLLCSTHLCGDPNSDHTTFHADSDLLRAATKACLDYKRLQLKPEIRTGGCVTVNYLVCSPAEKRALGDRYSAQVIDMESYALAELAGKAAIPFLALRAISDDVNEALPSIDKIINPTGSVRWLAALGHLLAHPADLLGFMRLARHARLAQASLAAWLPAVIPLISA